MSSLNRLKEHMGPEWGMDCIRQNEHLFWRSGGKGLAFFFRWSEVVRGEVVSDIIFDRTKVTHILFESLDEINALKAEFEEKTADYEAGRHKTKPKLDAPIFLSFIR